MNKTTFVSLIIISLKRNDRESEKKLAALNNNSFIISYTEITNSTPACYRLFSTACPLDTGRKLNNHRTFRRRPGHFPKTISSISRPYPIKFFKGCFPQNLLSPLLHTSSLCTFTLHPCPGDNLFVPSHITVKCSRPEHF